MLTHLAKSTLGLIAAICVTTAAFAQEIEAPQGDAILTVTGDITVTNMGDALVFDSETLAALGTESFETTTIWTDGLHSFEGVSLKTLTDLVGAKEGNLFATAINDYTIEIPVSDAVENGPIIAFLMDGEQMSVRDKGPLWIIYPYDTSADYRSETIYSRSIWQLDRIEVIK